MNKIKVSFLALVILLCSSCVIKKTAEYYFRQGKNEETKKDVYAAIKNYTKAIKLNQNYIESYIERASMSMSIDAYEDAVADYDSVLVRLDKNNYNKRGDLYLLKGDALYLMSEDSLACKCYEKSKDLNNASSWDRIRNRCKKSSK